MLFRRTTFLFSFPILLLLLTLLYYRPTAHLPSLKPAANPPAEKKPKPLYKPQPASPPPILDNFPLAARATSPSDLPPIPQWNQPPSPHIPESTPLFIGFTRNWRLLQQVVVSYITAGWPPTDIYVVDNTGVMHSNRLGLLSLQNPFYLDQHRLTSILGVNVLATPTLFTFAQLQNFYTFTALERNWTHYFWAHMDSPVVSDEEWITPEGKSWISLYMRAVEAMRTTMAPGWGSLASLWFSYDRLALVRTQAFVDVGGWDTAIPFYMTDCDMHERLWMEGLKIENADAGKVWDVADAVDDLGVFYQRGKEEGGEAPNKKVERDGAMAASAAAAPAAPSASPHPSSPSSTAALSSPLYHSLLHALDAMQTTKNAAGGGGRNTWQSVQRGGQGEPFYRDPDGFEKAVVMWMDFGKNVFYEKWGRGGCNLRDVGMGKADAWRVVRDWEVEGVRKVVMDEDGKREREEREREKEKEKEKGEGEKATA